MTHWDIRREGRAWQAHEMPGRAALRPEKLEIVAGKLLFSDEERIQLLGLLLENVGADQAVRLGSRWVWSEALERLREQRVRLLPGSIMDRWFLAMMILAITVPLVMVAVAQHLPEVAPVPAILIAAAAVAAVVSFGINALLRL